MGSRGSVLAATVVALTMLAACTPDDGGGGSRGTPSPPATTSTPGGSGQAVTGSPEVLVTGLEVPWGIAFLPDGSALVSERDRHRIVRVTADGDSEPVGDIDGVSDDTSEGGLMGLALSPEVREDRLVYAYLTADADNRVISFRYGGGRVRDQQPVFTGIPKATIHDGGRIAFGPDKMLYVATGDATQQDRAQDTDYLGGKILRMTPAGEPAPGNPDGDSVVYTVGHRNPQGLAWGPGDRLYQAEFGNVQLDELNLLRPGRNYGWPDVEGTLGPRRDEFESPLQTWATGEASPSGLAYAGGSLWLATLQGKNLYRMPVTADGSVGKPRPLYDDRWGRLRTVTPAPDGSLWVTTSNKDGRGDLLNRSDRIIRIPLR
ncbi:MAG: PQQ-dependent sugar dehydrogenase [Streptosporangiales bacterium]|nr:PQQ-dependent sugar dehydrogenase [Streptosporangiales bacterium]